MTPNAESEVANEIVEGLNISHHVREIQHQGYSIVPDFLARCNMIILHIASAQKAVG